MSDVKVPAVLALADGKVFRGFSAGAYRGEENPVLGEVVFNTSMYGYQEILSDPSYAGQIMTFTYPHIGNVGCNFEDEESGQVFLEGIICREISKRTSNFRAVRSLSEHLENRGKLALFGIDTRELVAYTRDNGSQMGAIACGDPCVDSLIDKAKSMGTMSGKDYVHAVSCKSPYLWKEKAWSLGADFENKERTGIDSRILNDKAATGRPHVVALDCGIKFNILRLLVDCGFRVTVLPAGSTSSEILAKAPDGVFLSNGPGDPAALPGIVESVKGILGKVPLFGICLGHQILALALGGKTFKLKFGHRGGNHPVMDMTTGKVEITVQNHGFAVVADSLPKDVQITHVNLNDQTIEGLEVESLKAFSIQYHPEASPGPHDSRYLFDRFYSLVTNGTFGRR